MFGFSNSTDTIVAAIFLASKACFAYPLLHDEADEYKKWGGKLAALGSSRQYNLTRYFSPEKEISKAISQMWLKVSVNYQ